MDESPAFLSSVRMRKGHFRLESGHHSDCWFDLESLCLRPAEILPFTRQLAVKLRAYGPELICGALNEGAFVSLLVASELRCEFAYTERFARPDREALFSVEYRLPDPLRPLVCNKRVAIVNDVTSAGSAVRGTFASLKTSGAHVVAIGSLLVLGDAIASFQQQEGVAIEALIQQPFNVWTPLDCPLCESRVPLDAR